MGKKLYTLEGRPPPPPSAFVRLVLGEGLSTLADFVQNSRREQGLWGRSSKEPAHNILIFPQEPRDIFQPKP